MSVWLADLPDACRTSGLPVVLEPGWATRGHGPMSAVRGIVCHHTAGPATGEYPSLRTVRDGVSAVSGPLAQLGMGRSGTIYVIAAGLSYHAGSGSWPGLSGNSDCIGIEAESVGTRDDWTSAQRFAWPRLCGALAKWYRIPARLVIGHKEWTPRKIDPIFINMDQLRAGLIYPGTGGFLMALSDAEQAEALQILRRMEPILRDAFNKAAIGTDITAQNRATLAAQNTALDTIETDTSVARILLADQEATIVATIVAAIAAAGGTVEHAIVDQAVRGAVASLTIVLPDPDDAA